MLDDGKHTNLALQDHEKELVSFLLGESGDRARGDGDGGCD